MKLSLKTLILPLSAILLSSCISLGGGGNKTTTIDNNDTQNNIDGNDVTFDKADYDGYYDTDKYDLNGKKSAALLFEIHKLLLDTHTSMVLYSQFNSYLSTNSNRPNSIDQVSETVAKNQYFYTGKEVNIGQSATREHVWPCAKSGGMWVHSNYQDPKFYVDGPGYVGGGSDLYHVRPCTSSVNNARGDSRFKEFNAEEKANAFKITDGGQYTLLCNAETFASYSEPADEMKGDVARILVYVFAHYSKMGNYNNDYCGQLKLLDVVGAMDEQGAKELLVKWDELDPVSETEKLRNNTVQKIQGNRNPFVDYPGLMRACFGL